MNVNMNANTNHNYSKSNSKSRSNSSTGVSRIGVLSISNIDIALRQLTTEYITRRVRFIALPKRTDQMSILEKDDPEQNMQIAIVLPLILRKYTKDFEKWQDNYTTSFETAMTAAYTPVEHDGNGLHDNKIIKSKSKSNSNNTGSGSGSGSATQWDMAEKQQRSLDVMSSTNINDKKIISSSNVNTMVDNNTNTNSNQNSMRSVSHAYSGLDHSPLLAAYQDSLKNENNTNIGEASESQAHYVSIITNGLVPEAELFRICRLLINNLEIKDRKYLLKEHKQAFLGR
mgnify:CR=1 FL=1